MPKPLNRDPIEMLATLRNNSTLTAGLVAFFCYSPVATAAIPEHQQAALRAIFIEAEGDTWHEDFQIGWSETGEVSCIAETITCDTEENVVGLFFAGRGDQQASSTARLSARVSELTELEYLGFIPQGMSTPLPASLASLPNLKHLQLDTYLYEGPYPEWLGEMPAIEILDFSLSSFSGPLPESIGNLSTLRELAIPANDNLSGSIPASIGNLVNLERLVLAQGRLEGTIPESIGNLVNLRELDLSHNKLVGEVPAAVSHLPLLNFSIDSDRTTTGSLFGNALYTEDQAIVNAPIYSQLTPVEQAHDAKVTRISYLGGDQASIQWEVFDWLRNTVTTQGLEGSHSHDHGYVIYTRVPDGNWNRIATIDDRNINTWQGTVPELSPSQSVEIQVRRLIGERMNVFGESVRELAESSGTQAPQTFIDVNVPVNNPPSFSSQNDVLNNASGQAVEIPAWASNLNDGDGNSQLLRFELKYLSNASLLDGVPHISVPSGTLRFQTRDDVAGETLVVFELCDIPSDINQAQACSAQKVFKIGVDNTAIPLPAFSVPAGLSTTSSELQKHTEWATELHDSAGNAFVSLAFETLWIENSELFDTNPWISSPSESLRFKFKEGVSGQATVYVHLRDYATGQISGVKSFVLEKTLDSQPPEIAPLSSTDVASDSLTQSRVDALGRESTGGGGSIGYLFLALGWISLRRVK